MVVSLQTRPSYAATFIGGLITSDTALKASGSPYYLANDLTISVSATLSIDSGVVIRSRGNFGIWVYGNLYINGTTNKPVIIQGNDLGGGIRVLWKGINVMKKTSDLKVRHTHFQNAQVAINYERVTVASSQPYPFIDIFGSAFEDNLIALRTTKNGNKGFVRFCVFKNNNLGIDGSGGYADSSNYIFYGNGLAIDHCAFTQNSIASIYLGHFNKSYFWKNASAIKFAAFGRIDSCIFEKNQLAVRGHTIEMYLNNFIANDTGLILHGDTNKLPLTMDRVSGYDLIFLNNKIGIQADNEVKGYLMSCSEFTNNKTAIKTPGLMYMLGSHNHEHIKACFFDGNDTAVVIKGQASYQPSGVSYDTSYFAASSNYFARGDYYVYNRTPHDVNLFKSIFIDTIRPVESYLYDYDDDTTLGAINYDTNIVTAVYDTNVRGNYYYLYETDSLILKHSRYSKFDTASTKHYVKRCRHKDLIIGIDTLKALNLGIKKTPSHNLRIPLIYPNPTKGELNVVLESGSLLEISIRDTRGTELIKRKYHKTNQHLQIDLGHLMNGFYFITIKSDQGYHFGKFIKN